MNSLDYSLALKHKEVVKNYKALIAFKQSCAGLHLGASEANKLLIKKDDSATRRNEIYYDIPDGSGGSYRIAHVNGGSSSPAPIDFSGYSLVLDTLDSGVALSEATPMESYQTLIAHKAA